MKKYWCLILVIIGFSLSYKVLADEVQQKTDGSFVGDKNSFVGQDTQNQTDSEFVGANTIQAENTYFAGDTYQHEVGNSTVVPFAEDNSQTAKDGVFLGEDVQKKTDGSFAGEDYGK